MALHFDLQVNGHKIGWFAARRLEEVPPDGISRYEVEIRDDRTGRRTAEIRHRYADPAFALVYRALTPFFHDLPQWPVGQPEAASGINERAARPSIHDPVTKSYAIDQITDPEHLRAIAHRMWEGFLSAHSQAAHAIAALTGSTPCVACEAAIHGDRERGCDEWCEWQVDVTAAFGSL